jgi:hypothetical protein
LEAVPHERTNTLNDAHPTPEIEMPETIGRDNIEMMGDSNGSTQIVNDDEMK